MKRRIYRLFSLDGRLLLEGTSDDIADMINTNNSVVTKNAQERRKGINHFLFKKYYVEDTREVKEKYVHKAIKNEKEDPLSEWELLELVLVKRKEKKCSLNKNPSKLVERLNKEYDLNCIVHEYCTVGKIRKRKKKSYVVEVVNG